MRKLLVAWIALSGCAAPPVEPTLTPAPQRDVIAWVIEDIPCCGGSKLADMIERQTVLLRCDPEIAALARAFEIEIVPPTEVWRFLSERVPATDPPLGTNRLVERQPMSVHRLRADGSWVGSVSLKAIDAREQLRRLLTDS